MRSLRWLTLALGLATCVSCIVFNGPGDLRRDLTRSTGVELDREMGVTLGRFGLGVVRLVTEDEDLPLEGVHKIEVGVYDIVRAPEEQKTLNFELPGYQKIARAHDGEDDVWVLVRLDRDRIQRLVLIVAGPDEWVLVRIRGDLDRVVEQVMELALARAEHEELIEPTLADYRSHGGREVVGCGSEPGELTRSATSTGREPVQIKM